MTEPEAASTTEPEEGGEQESQGLGTRHRRVEKLLTRLATTARSFTLYDPSNEAIHRFLTTLLDSFVAALADEGQIAFNVLPFEMKFEGQAVYLNRDRERSLAFRLYRDGVRTLTFYRGFDWEELSRLLEVLSIRMTGVQQREDDIVTLLWKANFKHVEISAVEGIVPDEGEHEPPAATGLESRPILPDEVDLPRPALPMPKGPTWVVVAEETQVALRREVATTALPWDCLALLERLQQLLQDPSARMPFAEAAHVFSEVRDFLLSEDHLPALKSFLAFLWKLSEQETPGWDPERHAGIYDLLDSCGDRRAVRRLLRSLPADERKLRPQLLEVLDRCCPDPVAAVGDVLAEEQSAAGRAVARQILEHYGSRKLDTLRQRFREASGQAASDLLRVIAGIGGEAATQFVAQQAAHTDPAVQDEALWHLANMPYTGIVGRALFEAFRYSDRTRRGKVLEVMARTRDFRFVDLLAGHVEEQAITLTSDEAASLGRVMGICGGPDSIPRWKAWLQPAGPRRRGFSGPPALSIAAALALSEIPGDEAAEALGEAFDSADEHSQPWILGALAQRQRMSGGDA